MLIDIATSNYATVLALIEYYFNKDLTFKINVYLPCLFIYQLFLHFLVVTNNVVMNMCVQVFVWTYVSIYLAVELLKSLT